ncbi:MAG: hypothetical protein QM695_16060 [Micropruina sp.]
MSATVCDWPEPDQVPRMLRHVSAERLEDALRTRPLPEGEWCVRRLDVAVELDPERPLSALETDWADRIVTALRLSLRDGSPDVVRYIRPEAAVDELLAGLCSGRFDHAWAWRQVGLLEPGDPEPHSAPATVFLLVLGRLQHGRLAALARLVNTVGVPPVHRLLGRTGWVEAARLVAAESGIAWTPSGESPPVGASGVGSAAVATPASRTEDPLPSAFTGTGRLAADFRACGLRVPDETLEAWAVLVLAASDPSALRRPPARLRPLLTGIGALVRPAASAGLGVTGTSRAPVAAPSGRRPTSAGDAPAATEPGDAGPGPDRTEPSAADRRPSGFAPARRGSAPRDTRARPGATEDHDEQRGAGGLEAGTLTQWGGLLFLLNSAAAAGLPELLDEPPFSARPARWVVRLLGLTLVPVGPGDPALRAFTGMTEDAPQNLPDGDESRAIRKLARRWTAVTASRLRTDGRSGGKAADAALVRRMARRRATIAQEPGWVEVGLHLTEVDTDVRRAGLDVNPGWVWWLGHVVRFRYE